MEGSNVYFTPILRGFGVEANMAGLGSYINQTVYKHLPYCDSPTCVTEFLENKNPKIRILKEKLNNITVKSLIELAFPEEYGKVKDEILQKKFRLLTEEERQKIRDMKTVITNEMAIKRERLTKRIRTLSGNLLYKGGVLKEGVSGNTCSRCGSSLIWRKVRVSADKEDAKALGVKEQETDFENDFIDEEDEN